MAISMPAEAPHGLGLSRGRRQVIFAFLMLSMFMATLDNQVVATALPSIVGDLGGMEQFGWVAASYLLAQSTVMPIYGKLGDLFGRKYVMMAAVAIFIAGSLACALAPTMPLLIAARALQGLGGGGIMVSIFAINSDLFEPRERARYQSFSSLVLVASGSLGPTIGGVLTSTFGWRSIFLINVPVAAAALLGLHLLLPYLRPARQPRIDWAGALTLAAAIAAIVLLADGAQLFGALISWPSLGLVAIAVLALIAWVRIERRAPEPIIPLTLFRDPVFPLMLLVALTSGGIAIGMVNFHALFLQTTTGLSPAHAGLFFIAITGGIATGSITAGRYISRSGDYRSFLLAGLTLCTVMLVLLSRMGPETPRAVIAAVLLLQGIGIGMGQQAPILGAQASAPRGDVGAATGAVTLMRMAGAALAISAYGAILSGRLAAPALQGLDTPHRYAAAFTAIYLTAACIAVVGLVAAIVLRPTRLAAAKSTSGG
ncbi:MDR family MFS transporter [Falsirhodobacter algicola]|nr:MDR family MFS transporter [Falsirhodobacter algicola]